MDPNVLARLPANSWSEEDVLSSCQAHGKHAANPDDETLHADNLERADGFRVLLSLAIVEQLDKEIHGRIRDLTDGDQHKAKVGARRCRWVDECLTDRDAADITLFGRDLGPR